MRVAAVSERAAGRILTEAGGVGGTNVAKRVGRFGVRAKCKKHFNGRVGNKRCRPPRRESSGHSNA